MIEISVEKSSQLRAVFKWDSMCLLLHCPLLGAPYLMFTLELVLGRPVTPEAVISPYLMTCLLLRSLMLWLTNYWLVT